jgi:hypothetical protein
MNQKNIKCAIAPLAETDTWTSKIQNPRTDGVFREREERARTARVRVTRSLLALQYEKQVIG